MTVEFSEVVHYAQIESLAEVAKEIWTEYFPGIISAEQTEYMIENYQSAPAVSNQIKNGYQYFLVVADPVILGYLSIKVDGKQLFISKLYLKKEYRGKGCFNQMLAFIEQFAKDSSLVSLYLTVNRHNEHSIAIYKKKGFAITNELATDIGNGFVMDDYIMEKKLA